MCRSGRRRHGCSTARWAPCADGAAGRGPGRGGGGGGGRGEGVRRRGRAAERWDRAVVAGDRDRRHRGGRQQGGERTSHVAHILSLRNMVRAGMKTALSALAPALASPAPATALADVQPYGTNDAGGFRNVL